jgi:hypothetical protein
MRSSFKTDLKKEQILSNYLDLIYHKLGFSFSRNTDMCQQLKGIDLQITIEDKTYNIDEKAQLHYLNKELPTFTFEVSYLKNNQHKTGWLLDELKETEFYFLITSIFLNSPKLRSIKDIKSCKIISVNRKKLTQHLSKLQLNKERLQQYDFDLRQHEVFGKSAIKELGNNGCLYYSNNLKEAPINVQFRLSYLLENGFAKKIHPI